MSMLMHNHFPLHLHANSPFCCLSAATMGLSKSLSHHTEMDFLPRPCGRGRGDWERAGGGLPFICRVLGGCQTRQPPSWRKANSGAL